MSKHSVATDIETTKGEQGVFVYGENPIHYDVVRKPNSIDVSYKNARKVVIKVHPNKRVVVMVPFDATKDAIHETMRKRARWIWQRLDEFSKQTSTVLPKRYVSGETQFYLGRRYVLKVINEPESTTNVRLSRGKLIATLQVNPNSDNDERAAIVKTVIDKWYKDKAKVVFRERLFELLPKTTWVSDIPSFRVMSMKTQWGSCSSKGNLMLNPHLIKAPKECIDYVILHELCHIAEHNHSEKFWRLLAQVMPNWKEVKAKLDGMAEMYLNQ